MTKDARSMADRCGEIAALLEATSVYQRLRANLPQHRLKFDEQPIFY
jgi:hypothetical protein